MGTPRHPPTPPPTGAQTAPSHSGMMQGQLRALPRSQLLTSSSNEVSSKMTARGSLRAAVSPSYSGVTCPSEHQPISWRNTSEPPNTPEVPSQAPQVSPSPSPSNYPPPRTPPQDEEIILEKMAYRNQEEKP